MYSIFYITKILYNVVSVDLFLILFESSETLLVGISGIHSIKLSLSGPLGFNDF